MRRFVRRVLVVALSVALAAGGAAFGAHAVPKAHSDRAANAHSHHATHVHHHGDHVAVQDEQQPAPSDRTDTTCCTMCVVASPLPPVFDGDVTPRITAVHFVDPSPYRIETSVRVDPGIPKSPV